MSTHCLNALEDFYESADDFKTDGINSDGSTLSDAEKFLASRCNVAEDIIVNKYQGSCVAATSEFIVYRLPDGGHILLSGQEMTIREIPLREVAYFVKEAKIQQHSDTSSSEENEDKVKIQLRAQFV